MRLVLLAGSLVLVAQMAAASAPACGTVCSSHQLAVESSSEVVLAAQGTNNGTASDSRTVYGTLKSSSATPIPQATLIFRVKKDDGTLEEAGRVMTDAYGKFSTMALEPGTEYQVEYRWTKSRRKGYLFFRKHVRTPMKADLGTMTLRAGEENVITLPAKLESVEVPKEEQRSDREKSKGK